jgi:tetratricopeptide (TPR) repeat protein
MKCVPIIIILFLFSCYQRSKPKEIDNIKADMGTLIGKADLLYQMSDYIEAIKAYSELIEKDSMNGEFYYRRGFSYSQLKDPKFINDDFLRAAQLGYRRYDCYYILGINYGAALNDSLAVYYFKKALRERPGSKEVQKMLDVFEVKNDKSL